MRHRHLSLLVLMSLLLAAPGVQAATFRSIDGNKVNLRAGPGTDQRRLYQVSDGYPVKVVGRSGDWVKVQDYEGDRAWVHANLLSEQRMVLVTRKLVNVRKGPSTKRDIAFKAQRNVLLHYLGKKGDWVHVRHTDGDEGWVYAPLVWGE